MCGIASGLGLTTPVIDNNNVKKFDIFRIKLLYLASSYGLVPSEEQKNIAENFNFIPLNDSGETNKEKLSYLFNNGELNNEELSRLIEADKAINPKEYVEIKAKALKVYEEIVNKYIFPMLKEDFITSLLNDMVEFPAGSFIMGSPENGFKYLSLAEGRSTDFRKNQTNFQFSVLSSLFSIFNFSYF